MLESRPRRLQLIRGTDVTRYQAPLVTRHQVDARLVMRHEVGGDLGGEPANLLHRGLHIWAHSRLFLDPLK